MMQSNNLHLARHLECSLQDGGLEEVAAIADCSLQIGGIGGLQLHLITLELWKRSAASTGSQYIYISIYIYISEVGGFNPTGKLFRVVRACMRGVWL